MSLRAISLGWGIQSWTLAAMSGLGELEPIDVALHSDTTWERSATYEFAKWGAAWLEEHDIPVVTVSDVDQAKKVISEPDIPAFTSKVEPVRGNVDHIPAHLAKAEPVVRLPNGDLKITIPAHTTYGNNKVSVLNRWNNEPEIPAHHSYPDGKPSGMLRRQCTQRWKIEPMRRWLRAELVRRQWKKVGGVVEQWLGISLDEVHRAKDSDVKWIQHRFPLLEKKMTRQDCIVWLQQHGLPVPPKSSCVFCPYHTRKAFGEMKRANGSDWQTAVMVDEAIRDKRPGFVAYVHPDRIPLIEVKIAEDFGMKQSSLFGDSPPYDNPIAQAAKIVMQEKEYVKAGYRVVDGVWKKVEEPEVDTVNAECDSGYCFL